MNDLIYWPDEWFGDASLFRDANGAFKPESELSADQILAYAMANQVGSCQERRRVGHCLSLCPAEIGANQRMKLTRAAILVPAPAAYP